MAEERKYRVENWDSPSSPQCADGRKPSHLPEERGWGRAGAITLFPCFVSTLLSFGGRVVTMGSRIERDGSGIYGSS